MRRLKKKKEEKERGKGLTLKTKRNVGAISIIWGEKGKSGPKRRHRSARQRGKAKTREENTTQSGTKRKGGKGRKWGESGCGPTPDNSEIAKRAKASQVTLDVPQTAQTGA